MTVYGYMIAAGNKYITIWNSGLNNGKGGTMTVGFKDKGTTFSYASEIYTWRGSISEY